MSELIKDLVDAADNTKIIRPNIVRDNIPANAVNGSKIESGAVSTAKIADGAITGIKIADSTITEQKIFNGAITESKLYSNSVSNTKIQNNAITNTKIQDNTIEFDKFYDKGYVCVIACRAELDNDFTLQFKINILWKDTIDSAPATPLTFADVVNYLKYAELYSIEYTGDGVGNVIFQNDALDINYVVDNNGTIELRHKTANSGNAEDFIIDSFDYKIYV